MSYTFICTPHKEWYLKISTLEDLIKYWKVIFNPQIKEAYETIFETKEFGHGMNHSTALQTAIGLTARGEVISLKAAYEKIMYDNRINQYQAICDGHTIFINDKLGWSTESKEVEQFVHKTEMKFPIMDPDKIQVKQFPMGKHFYVFVDGVQLRQKENVKFNSYEEALNYAKEFVKHKEE